MDVGDLRGDDPAAPERLDALLNAYDSATQDERNAVQVTAILVSVAIALLGAIGGVLLQTCSLRGLPPGTPDCLDIPDWVNALLPLGPLAVLAHFMPIATTSTARYFYLRTLEREIAFRTGAAAPLLGRSLHGAGRLTAATGDTPALPIPSFYHLVHPVHSQRTGWRRFRYFITITYLGVGVTYVGLTIYLLTRTDPLWVQIIASGFYTISTLLLVYASAKSTIGGRRLWTELVRELPESYRRPLLDEDASRRGRRLLLYLVLPRPPELIKGLFFLGAAFISATAVGAPFLWAKWLTFYVAFELLVYQARYTLNDLRDAGIDAREASIDKRGRFPPPITRQRVRAVILAVVVRVACWLAITSAIGRGFDVVLLWSGVGVFAIAMPYEWARSRLRLHSREEFLEDWGWVTRMNSLKLTLFVTVGLGYALRTSTGLWVGSAMSTDLPLLVVGALTFSTFGSMFVLMTWVLQASGMVTGGAAPGPQLWKHTLLEKSHIATLAAQAGLLESPARLADHIEDEDTRWDEFPLREPVNPKPFTTAWNRALLVAGTLAGWTGIGLAHAMGLPQRPTVDGRI
jgi:hypothetical protein